MPPPDLPVTLQYAVEVFLELLFLSPGLAVAGAYNTLPDRLGVAKLNPGAETSGGSVFASVRPDGTQVELDLDDKACACGGNTEEITASNQGAHRPAQTFRSTSPTAHASAA